jgi:hypothetical protein
MIRSSNAVISTLVGAFCVTGQVSRVTTTITTTRVHQVILHTLYLRAAKRLRMGRKVFQSGPISDGLRKASRVASVKGCVACPRRGWVASILRAAEAISY